MSDKEFKNLKALLLQPERDDIQKLTIELNRLKDHLNRKEQLISTIKPVLSPILRQKIEESPEEIADILAPVIGESLRKQVEISRQEIIDALYPVIGQTIRKSIAEAMRKLAQAVNEKVDRALSVQLIFKKFKSRITGVREEELLLTEALPFRILEIFYIHKESGLLIAHLSDQQKLQGQDQDIVSGMLTAIRDFARKAFSDQEDRDLSEIQYDDLQIFLEAGRYAYLAVVLSGVPPRSFREELRKLERAIHKKYHSLLREYRGETRKPNPLDQKIGNFLRDVNRSAPGAVPGSPPGSSLKGLWYLAILLFLLAATVTAIFYLPGKVKEYRMNSVIRDTQGTEPLNQVSAFRWRWKDNQLVIEGSTPGLEQKKQAEDFLKARLGIARIDNTIQAIHSTEYYQNVHSKLRLRLDSRIQTDLSQIQLVPDGENLMITGRVHTDEEKAVILSTLARLTDVPIIVSYLVSSEDISAAQQQITRRVENTLITFSPNQIRISPGDTMVLNRVGEDLKTISFEKLYIIGFSDSVGNPEENLKISRERSAAVREFLIGKGLDPGRLVSIGKGEEAPRLFNPRATYPLSRRCVILTFQNHEK